MLGTPSLSKRMPVLVPAGSLRKLARNEMMLEVDDHLRSLPVFIAPECRRP